MELILYKKFYIKYSFATPSIFSFNMKKILLKKKV